MMTLHRWPALAAALNVACALSTAASAQPMPAPAAPTADLTGKWSFVSEGGRAVPIVLRQEGSVVTGEMPTPPTMPKILFSGVMEGAQMDIMAHFPYEGGELVHLRAEYKDGRLVGRINSIHSSPRKWKYDSDRAVVGAR